MQEIKINSIKNIKIGQVENKVAGTGCTVIISPEGMTAGIDVRGGSPASRDTQLLDPMNTIDKIHAVLLSGGSAFGLDAAGGVMQYLEEKSIGYQVGITKVPIVCQSSLFDLTVGDHTIRPDKKMGYAAAKTAMESPNYQDGNFGAGCGAVVGKLAGIELGTKTGIGSYALSIEKLKIGAIVALNAYGDIFDWKTGQKIAGILTEDKKQLRDTESLMAHSIENIGNRFVNNTTLGVIITNAKFNKAQLKKIAGMAHDGYARSIRPVHLSCDGDSIYALSVGELSADMDLVGILAARAMSEAIIRAVVHAESAYGHPAHRDLQLL